MYGELNVSRIVKREPTVTSVTVVVGVAAGSSLMARENGVMVRGGSVFSTGAAPPRFEPVRVYACCAQSTTTRTDACDTSGKPPTAGRRRMVRTPVPTVPGATQFAAGSKVAARFT